MKFVPGLLLSVCPLLLSGCGNPGSPLPPSLMLSVPVADLAAARTGDTVSLTWTVSHRTTDRLLLKGDQRITICRAVAHGPCLLVGVTLREAAKPAQFDDTLPPVLALGTPQLLRYEVRMVNHSGRSAGASNPAFAAAGAAPPPIREVSAAATAHGILVRWSTAAENAAIPPVKARLLVRLQRDRILRPGESVKPGRRETNAGVPQPIEQTLEAPEQPPSDGHSGWNPSHILDAEAMLNRVYRYTVQLVQEEPLEGHLLTIAGSSAESAAVDAKDIFPPAAPAELDAVANAVGRSIDLSWTPDAGPGTIGYFVYRRVAGTAGTAVRVSGKQPLPVPGWSDRAAQPGVRYAYSVSAVDASGNESAHSAEAVEALPTGTPSE